MATKKQSTNSYRHVLKYTGLFGGVQVFNILVGLVRNKFVAVLLGPMGMGLVTLLNTSMSFISQATSLGVAFSAIRRISELHDKGDAAELEHYIAIVRKWSLVAAVLGAVVCIAAGPLLNYISFSWGDHTLHFVLLAPAVAMTALCGGELAILKGTQRLKELAYIQVLVSLLSLIVTIPLYYQFNYKAIVPVISLIALINFLPAFVVSCRHHPYRVRSVGGFLTEGRPMVKMGVAFTFAAAFSSGSDMLVRALLNQVADLHVVGLYNAAYMITITYSSMVFSSMESDFFPRLSAVNRNNAAVSGVVNRQMEVSLLLISPMLCGLIVFLPIIIPLLLSSEFIPVVAMAQMTTLAMFFKAMSLPMAYVNLAKANSRVYLLFESFYAVMFVVFVVAAFQLYGLLGAGFAVVAAHVVEYVLLLAYLWMFHSFRMSTKSLLMVAVHLPLLVAIYASSQCLSGCSYWLVGMLLTAISSTYSLYRLKRMRKT